MTTENESPENTGTEEVVLDDAAMLEAVSNAVDEVSPHLQEDDDNGDNTDDDTGAAESGAEPEGEADTDEADDGAAEGSDETSEDDGGAGGDSSDSDKADGDSGSEGKGDDVPELDKDGKPIEVPQPDHLNDPIPEGTKEQTAARITGLIDIAKTQTTRAEQGDQFINAVTEVCPDPEQFNNTLGFLGLYNSKDPEKRKSALEVARGVVHELSMEFGEGTAELLTLHPDLQAQVEANELTEKIAIEIATTRENKKITDARTTQDQERDDSAADAEAGRQIGGDQLRAFENVAKIDPDYVVLYPTFKATLAQELRKTDSQGRLLAQPDQWGIVAQRVYSAVKAAYKPAVAPKKPGKQPLRAKQGAGSSSSTQKEGPKTAEEAVDAALSEM